MLDRSQHLLHTPLGNRRAVTFHLAEQWAHMAPAFITGSVGITLSRELAPPVGFTEVDA
jgi:hypothetical protein